MPAKIASVHHSIEDWDFDYGDEHRSLAVDQFISVPSSLKFSGAPRAWGTHVLCRIPGTLVLPQGEVRTWSRRYYGSHGIAVFRHQTALGEFSWQNLYYVSVHPAWAVFTRVLDGVPSNRGSTDVYFANDEWIHYRTFWYNGKTPGGVDALCVDIYVEIDGEWVKQGSTMYDTGNYFKDSETNRCGLRIALGGGQSAWYDDTEIWGPV
ncbi:hypothetical protein ES705_41329 [subsurface metagenome]